jgi:hypothetical protein
VSAVFTTGKTGLTEALESALNSPASSSDFDLLANTNDVLRDVGLTATDCGGRLSFYGQDPIISSPHRFGAMAAIGLAAKSVAAAALWQARTGEPRTSTSTFAKRCVGSVVSSTGNGKR